MPSSPKLNSTLPRVNIARRGSVQVAKRFFFGRRGLRRTFILFTFIAIVYYVLFKHNSQSEYDMRFMEDTDEDIVQHASQARKSHREARLAMEREREWKARVRPPMTRSDDGLVRVGDWEGRHPLFEVIATAEQEWKSEMDFRPSTIGEAYEAYMIMYGKPPPFSYPDMFSILPPQCPIPLANSLYLYKPLTPDLLRRYETSLEGSPMTITIIIRNGRAGGGAAEDEDGMHVVRDISRHLMNVLLEIGEFLPDLRFTLSADYPRNPVPSKLREDMADLLRLGERFDLSDAGDDDDGEGTGVYNFREWSEACAASDPVNNGVEIKENSNNTLKFIYTNHPLSPCRHPSLFSLSDYFSGPAPNVGVLVPVFAFSQTAVNGDILLPRPDTSQAVPSKVPWGKKRSTLYWRGTASLGGSTDELVVPINRLMTMFDQKQHVTSAKRHVLVPHDGDGFEVQDKRPFELLATGLDLAFTSCSDKTGCQDMRERYRFVDASETQWEHSKFVLDIESYSGSTMSFRQLLLSGSLVFRSSLFEDFWVSQAKPWVHYVPLQPDFSDLQTILLFFEANDHIAKRIATAGQALARECFGRSGIKAGLLTVLGEYGRMWNDEGSDADMVPPAH